MYKHIINLVVILISAFSITCAQPAAYTVFLNKPVPDNIEVSFNAPVLRWPVEKGKSVKYDVRVSDSPLFNSKNTFGEERISWAMYNPHRILKPGVWYWQYRVSGKAWPEPFRFTVNPAALSMVSPSAKAFLDAIPKMHPRVLTGSKSREEIRALERDPDARSVIEAAESALIRPVPKEEKVVITKNDDDKDRERKKAQDAVNTLANSVQNMVLPFAQAYLLTGNDKYAKKAIEVIMEVASWDPDGISAEEDFADVRCMRSMAIGYDTFYDQLSTAQRELLVKAIKARASRFYNGWVNVQEAKVLSGHVWQHILHYFFESVIAIYNDNDPASRQWLTYAYELFLARAPVLGALDGGWGEGASYFRMNMETLIEIPMMIRMYTGFDFIKTHPWYRNQSAWLIYNVPPGSFSDGYGDNNETVNNQLFYHYNKTGGDSKHAVNTPIASYMAFAQELAKLMQDAKAAWYVNNCRKYEVVNMAAEPTLRWFRLTRTHDLKMPSDTNNLKFPMANLATGVTAMHTNPSHTPDDLAVFMRSSPFGAYGHILADQNTFNILYGGKRLFYRTGFKISMNDPHRTAWYQQTKSTNGILINGEGQPISIEAGGSITRLLQGNNMAYTKGDASNAYRSKQTKEDLGVKKFYRHILLLKPDIIVIYDELESEKEANWSWLIHSMNKIVLDPSGNSFSTSLENVRGIGKLWSPIPVKWAISDTFTVPVINWRHPENTEVDKDYSQDQWHITATNTVKTGKLRFLTVLKVGEQADIQQFKEMNRASGDVHLAVGDWIIEASLSADKAPSLSVYNPSVKTAFSAYGDQLKTAETVFKGRLKNSSKLAELTGGKMKFTEAVDIKPEPLR